MRPTLTKKLSTQPISPGLTLDLNSVGKSKLSQGDMNEIVTGEDEVESLQSSAREYRKLKAM